jgi:hypothetical protein
VVDLVKSGYSAARTGTKECSVGSSAIIRPDEQLAARLKVAIEGKAPASSVFFALSSLCAGGVRVAAGALQASQLLKQEPISVIMIRAHITGRKNEAMQFENACFVSYRHPDADGALAARFIDDLSAALKSELGAWMNERLYVDRERLKPGMFFNQSLAYALCKSICMVVVYTPNYFHVDNPYCALEYITMERLEKRRFARLPGKQQGGLIIPIILRGAKDLPSTLRDRRLYVSFEGFTLYSERIAYNPYLEPEVRKIVEYIDDYRKLFARLPEEIDCNSFAFPTQKEAMDWLRESPSSVIHDFPFRSRT